VVQQGIWRIRTIQELKELYKDPEIVADIKKKRLEWTGYVVRMDQERTYKKIF
jgi:3-keto-L-gulonate-6-phosphate decarboxylase